MEWLKSRTDKTFFSLRIYNYRLYFLGQLISTAGVWMQLIAQSWLVLQLTNSGTAVGLVPALQFLPIMLVGPFGGVVADMFPKRKVLFVTQTILAALSITLGLLILTGNVELWMVYALALGVGMTAVVDNPTRSSFIMELVGKDHLTNAVTLNAIMVNATRVLGPAAAGVLIASVGLAWCFIVNSVTYFAVIVALLMMRRHELQPSQQAPRERGQLRQGIEYVWRTPVLRNTLAMLTVIGMFTYEFGVSLPLVARFTFNGDARTLSLLSACMGIGSIVGGLYVAGHKSPEPRNLVTTALLFGAAVLAAAVAPDLLLACAALVAAGIASVTFISLSNTTLQLRAKPEMRGRVMVLWSVGFFGTTPIGGPIVGYVGEHFSPRWSLAVGGFAAVLAGLAGWVALWRAQKSRRRAAQART